jgi:hypothetical protein
MARIQHEARILLYYKFSGPDMKVLNYKPALWFFVNLKTPWSEKPILQSHVFSILNFT